MGVIRNVNISNRANARSREVIGAAIDVHRALGPGFLESAYEEALCMELYKRDIPFARQREVAICYKSREIGTGRVDIVVDESLIIELKAVDALAPVHTAQLLSIFASPDVRSVFSSTSMWRRSKMEYEESRSRPLFAKYSFSSLRPLRSLRLCGSLGLSSFMGG